MTGSEVELLRVYKTYAEHVDIVKNITAKQHGNEFFGFDMM